MTWLPSQQGCYNISNLNFLFTFLSNQTTQICKSNFDCGNLIWAPVIAFRRQIFSFQLNLIFSNQPPSHELENHLPSSSGRFILIFLRLWMLKTVCVYVWEQYTRRRQNRFGSYWDEGIIAFRFRPSGYWFSMTNFHDSQTAKRFKRSSRSSSFSNAV